MYLCHHHVVHPSAQYQVVLTQRSKNGTRPCRHRQDGDQKDNRNGRRTGAPDGLHSTETDGVDLIGQRPGRASLSGRPALDRSGIVFFDLRAGGGRRTSPSYVIAVTSTAAAAHASSRSSSFIRDLIRVQKSDRRRSIPVPRADACHVDVVDAFPGRRDVCDGKADSPANALHT